ncbi:MAG TPA: methyltransferase domain-containing protein [Vicinamibacterales bacterium]|nr:methyltransferase domain-containing protein [Vicinamibacterales bacterium]
MRKSFLPVITLIFYFAAQAVAQTPPQTFQPQVGQPGKDVVWVPTSQALVDKMLDVAKVTPQDVVIDLGSGDGRTVITAAKRGARAFGIEYNPDMVELSKHNATTAGVADKATFQKADLFETDLSQASVITMFLLPDINLRLRPKILGLKPGTRIVSNTFNMGEWEADETVHVGGDCGSWCTALLWIVPAKVEGTWRFPQNELKLTQAFQTVGGSLGGSAGGVVTNGKLRGDQLTFTVGGGQFSGRVNGDVIEGTLTANGRNTSWRGTRVAGQ